MGPDWQQTGAAKAGTCSEHMGEESQTCNSDLVSIVPWDVQGPRKHQKAPQFSHLPSFSYGSLLLQHCSFQTSSEHCMLPYVSIIPHDLLCDYVFLWILTILFAPAFWCFSFSRTESTLRQLAFASKPEEGIGISMIHVQRKHCIARLPKTTLSALWNLL